MSGFSKHLSGKHVPGCPYANYDFTVRIMEDYERCLTPAYSPAVDAIFDTCDCDCDSDDHDDDESEDGNQSYTSHLELKPRAVPGSGGMETLTGQGNMTEGQTMASFNRELDKGRAERIAYLKGRLLEIHEIIAAEKEVHREWKVNVKEKFEEFERAKTQLLAKMKREEMMNIARRDFIMVLMSINFEHEVENVYGGRKMFRSFREFQ